MADSTTATEAVAAVSSQQSQLFSVSSADVLRLIQAHLTECGLHQTVRTLQRESGVGLAASFAHQQQQWKQQAATGQWDAVLRGLSVLDKDRCHLPASLLAAVHEMAILELAELGEWQTAFAVFRLLQQDDDMASAPSDLSDACSDGIATTTTVSRSLEQKLADLAAARQKDAKGALPVDFYGGKQKTTDKSNSSAKSVEDRKQARREELGNRLQEAIPRQPPQRLPTLLQQAIKWQSYTGQLPRIRRWWEEDEEDGAEEAGGKKKKRRKIKEFDLVLGEVSVEAATVGDDFTGSAPAKGKPVSQDFATIKFGKQAVCEAAIFLPDGSGLATGSSDGLIEIWDTDGKLRTDLVYQQNDELLGHDNGAAVTAIAFSADTTLLASGSSDGAVNIWRIDTGKCLRTLQTSAAASGVASLAFSPESSHVLSANVDGNCREFGLRTARMLKEFRGHTSYLTTCSYEVIQSAVAAANTTDSHQLVVITASGDGSVRIWDGKTTDLLYLLKPISLGLRNSLSRAGSSIVAANVERANNTASEGSPTVHSVLKLHTPANTMILVPRGLRAFLVNYRGTVLRTFQDESSDAKETVFVAATVSATNRWLYAVKEDGKCCVFDVTTGKLETMIRDFGSISTSISSDATGAEISYLVHHPSRDILAAFSNNDKGRKKGRLVLWN